MAKGVLISMIIVALGVAWLLNTLHFIGGVDWLWTILLAGAGILTLFWGKLNKLTFVMGCFLIIGSVFSILRQTGVLSLDTEVPILVIVFGLLFLIAQFPAIPHTATFIAVKEEAKKPQK